MKRLKHFFAGGILGLTCLSSAVFAQQPPRADWANMDPQQMQQMIQQRISEALREPLAVTNDTEWRVIEARLSKVTQLRMETLLGAGMGMMGGTRRGANGPGGGFGGLAGLMNSDPNLESLQKTIDDRASSAQIKEALAKLREARKIKEEELAKAQEELRSVLTLRQEAILVQYGLLD